jgi:hypothetical protein
MVLVLQPYGVYREPILGFASQKVLADERIALVSPIIVSTCFSVLPGFAPARELVAWRVPEGATVVVEGKDPKPLTPRLASLERTDASLRRADQLAPLKQGPPADEGVPPLGQTAGDGPWEMNISVTHMKERGAIYSV